MLEFVERHLLFSSSVEGAGGEAGMETAGDEAAGDEAAGEDMAESGFGAELWFGADFFLDLKNARDRSLFTVGDDGRLGGKFQGRGTSKKRDASTCLDVLQGL